VPLYARPPSALHAAAQSSTSVAPPVVHVVMVPSPLHDEIVPEHGGKHASRTRDEGDVSSAHEAPASASAQADVTRTATSCR
jgi:hypothetical protein